MNLNPECTSVKPMLLKTSLHLIELKNMTEGGNNKELNCFHTGIVPVCSKASNLPRVFHADTTKRSSKGAYMKM